MKTLDDFSPSWLPPAEVPGFELAPARSCCPWGNRLVNKAWELEVPCYPNKRWASSILGQRWFKWSPLHNLHGNLTFFLDSFLPPPALLPDLFASGFPSWFFFLPRPFFFPLEFWSPLGLSDWTTLIEEVWEVGGLDDVTWLLEAVCKDNCCNWFNKFMVVVSTYPTIPSVWGPGFDLAMSTLNPGESGNYFCRIRDWE